ncbi:MAG: hypothetical protein KA248_10660 [Kiritimatiellae bacterium]|nr:hypothetical protein [Kiritimatiellia bacterium]
MKPIGTFPFGQPILPVRQEDRGPKKVFVLGVYASAVHARWIGPDGKQLISAVGVASEPEIFWRGDKEQAAEIIQRISLPKGAGSLAPANEQHNGPSGRALDELILQPLDLKRSDTWLCDLVPNSCMNPGQKRALKRAYDPLMTKLGLPAYNWPDVPAILACKERVKEIEAELIESKAELLITLGNLPLRWFASLYGAKTTLAEYGKKQGEYGQLNPIRIGNRKLHLRPLVHPRQAGRLGQHSRELAELHAEWIALSRSAHTVEPDAHRAVFYLRAK